VLPETCWAIKKH